MDISEIKKGEIYDYKGQIFRVDVIPLKRYWTSDINEACIIGGLELGTQEWKHVTPFNLKPFICSNCQAPLSPVDYYDDMCATCED